MPVFFFFFTIVGFLNMNVKLLCSTTSETTKTYIRRSFSIVPYTTVCKKQSFQIAWIENISSTFILFCSVWFCVSDRVVVLLTLKDVLYCVLSPVLRNACLLSVQKPFWLPAFIYHAIPLSNIYLLHVVYHLIHSIVLSVSFRIKQTETEMWIWLRVSALLVVS